jgi:hypothetical protein
MFARLTTERLKYGDRNDAVTLEEHLVLDGFVNEDMVVQFVIEAMRLQSNIAGSGARIPYARRIVIHFKDDPGYKPRPSTYVHGGIDPE